MFYILTAAQNDFRPYARILDYRFVILLVFKPNFPKLLTNVFISQSLWNFSC